MLEEGSLTAHVTIVARAMGVPVLGRVRDVRRAIGEGDLLLLDGDAGQRVRPPDRARWTRRSRPSSSAEPEAPRRIRRDARPAAGHAATACASR